MKKLIKSVLLPVTEEEQKVITDLASLLNTEQRNLLRRGLQLLAKEVGYELPENAFVDRKQGNKLNHPKSLAGVSEESPAIVA